MSRHFIVGINQLTDEQMEPIFKWLTEEYGWWHWIDGVWLIVDTTENFTAVSVRDKFVELVPSSNVIVFEVPKNIDWAGYGPKTDKRNMFKWLHETWDEVAQQDSQ